MTDLKESFITIHVIHRKKNFTDFAIYQNNPRGKHNFSVTRLKSFDAHFKLTEKMHDNLIH